MTAEILLLRADKIARGQAIHQKCDANVNPMYRSNPNHVLDTFCYKMEFSEGKIMKFSANIIAELTYAQCNMAMSNYC